VCDGWGRDYVAQRWIDIPFLWAESYFYRKLLDVTGFFKPGPWAGIDPCRQGTSAPSGLTWGEGSYARPRIGAGSYLPD
jgi:hypothetical protein